MKGTTADILVKYLEQEGVEYVFGVPGAHVLPIYDAISKSSSIKPILVKNEVGAAFMAFGYAAVTGKLGVCCATVGPGATNMITGITAAHMDSIPVLAITGQVGIKAFGSSAHQEATGYGRSVDQVALFREITKMSLMVTSKDTMSRTVRALLRTALSGRRGPVHLAFPSNIQLEQVSEEIQSPEVYRPGNRSSAPDALEIKKIGELLYEAKNPAMLIGHGASACATDSVLVPLAEKLQIPIATTPKAKGVFPEDHPLSLGVLSIRGSKAANTYLRSEIDVLLVAGSDLGELTSHAWDPKLQPSSALIQIDIDPEEIGKNYPVTIGVVADASLAIESISNYLSSFDPKPKRDLTAFMHSTQHFNEKESFSDKVPLKPQRLMRELRKSLPRDTQIFGDMGTTFSWILRYFQSYPEGLNFLPSGFACMGSSVAGCIGGKLGKPESPAVCICGDGDFTMTGMEVLTAVEYKIPIVWVILKNNKLAGIHDVQRLSYQGRFTASEFSEIDFVAIAEAFGARGFRVAEAANIPKVMQAALDIKGPVIVEAIIDPDEKFPMTSRATALKDSLGLPKIMDSISSDSIRALLKMFKNKEI